MARSRPELLPELPDNAWGDVGLDIRPPGIAERVQNVGGWWISFQNLQYPECPFLNLLLSPDTINMSYQKRVTTYETRGAWIEEHWGHDELDEISGSGISMIFSYLRKISEEGDPEAYAWVLPTGPERNRESTMGAINLQQWLQMYLNNGAMYNLKGQIDRFAGIALYFGPDVFFGYFQAFSIDDDAGKPWQKSYNFSFKVYKSFVARVVEGSENA